MSTKPWIKFYPSDWRSDPALRMVSIGARGLWMEIICLMHEAEPYGHLLIKGRSVPDAALAALAGITARDCKRHLGELERVQVFDRVDGVIISRRMVKDHEKALRDQSNGRASGGAPDLRGATYERTDRIKRINRKDNPTLTEGVWAKSGGVCVACTTPMQRNFANAPDAFTIEHKVPRAQGGSNDISNLEGMCRSCNRRKGLTPFAEFMAAGAKAQKPEARSQSLAASQMPLADAADTKAISDRLLAPYPELAKNPTGAFLTLGDIQAWLNDGATEADIATAMQAVMVRAKRPPGSWAYFRGPVAEAKAKRIAGLGSAHMAAGKPPGAKFTMQNPDGTRRADPDGVVRVLKRGLTDRSFTSLEPNDPAMRRDYALRLRVFALNGEWDEDDLGAPPHHPACIVPADLLAAHFAGQAQPAGTSSTASH